MVQGGVDGGIELEVELLDGLAEAEESAARSEFEVSLFPVGELVGQEQGQNPIPNFG